MDPRRGGARLGPRDDRRHDRQCRPPNHRPRPRASLHRAPVDGQRLLAHAGGSPAPWWLSRRPLRPAPSVRCGSGLVRRRVPPLRAGPEWSVSDRGASAAGDRRRPPDAGQPRNHRDRLRPRGQVDRGGRVVRPGRCGGRRRPGPRRLPGQGVRLVVYALTQGPRDGWTASETATLLVGVLTLAAFVVVEMRSPNPMLPLGLFRSRQFTVTNLVTFVVYAALGASFFLLPIQLQRVVGFSPVAAGAALTPITVVMLFLSARAGRLAQRIGPRLPMTLGPILAGAGFTLYVRIGPGSTYIADVLPGALVMALGLALTVAPLTATVLASAGEENAGIASAVSNEVARTAGLMAVAVLPAAVGISEAGLSNVAGLSTGF